MASISVKLGRGSGDTFGVDDLACAAATDLGFFSDEGLDVTWSDWRGGVASMGAALDGAVDVAYAGLGPVITYRADGRPCRIIVSMARGLAQALVVQNRITEPAQLQGVSWAVDGIGALSHHMARLIVAALGIPADSIRWDPVGPPPLRIDALLNDRIDVSLIRTEEALSLSRHHGDKVHTMLDFGELKELVPTQPHGVLATTEAFEQANPDVMERIAAGMIRASRALADDIEAFRTVVRKNVSIPLDDDEIAMIWERESGTGGFAVNGEMTRAHWDEEMRIYHDLDPGMRKVTYAELLAPQYVGRALERLGTHPATYDEPGT